MSKKPCTYTSDVTPWRSIPTNSVYVFLMRHVQEKTIINNDFHLHDAVSWEYPTFSTFSLTMHSQHTFNLCWIKQRLYNGFRQNDDREIRGLITAIVTTNERLRSNDWTPIRTTDRRHQIVNNVIRTDPKRVSLPAEVTTTEHKLIVITLHCSALCRVSVLRPCWP